MDRTLFLSRAIGIYLVVVSIAMLSNMQQFIDNVDNLVHNATLLFSLSFVTVILGTLLIVSHNIWQWHWRIVITIIAWLTFIKGATMMIYPQFIDALSIGFIASKATVYAGGIFDFVLGVFLCYAGFRAWKIK